MDEFSPTPNGRHTASPDDPVVRFLSNLESRKDLLPGCLELSQNIRVHPDCIEFIKEKIRIKRKNESAPADNRGIFEYGGNTLFSEKAVRHLFGKELPSRTDWERIIRAIPGNAHEEHFTNVGSILEIPDAGRFDFTNREWRAGATNIPEAYLWTGSRSKSGRLETVSRWNHPGNHYWIIWDACGNDYQGLSKSAFSVRLLAD